MLIFYKVKSHPCVFYIVIYQRYLNYWFIGRSPQNKLNIVKQKVHMYKNVPPNMQVNIKSIVTLDIFWSALNIGVVGVGAFLACCCVRLLFLTKHFGQHTIILIAKKNRNPISPVDKPLDSASLIFSSHDPYSTIGILCETSMVGVTVNVTV